jgi:hypothetical protein
MVTLHVHLRVADYLAWKRNFDDVMSSSSSADSVRSYRIWRGEDDRGLVVCEYTFDSRLAAEAFVHNPALELAIERANPSGSAFFEYLDEVAFRSS